MEKIRKYVETLFIECPNTKKVTDLKEELICDLEEKYSDLIKDGKSEKVAFDTIIAGIGDIDELIINLKRDYSPIDYHYIDSNRKKTALIVTICVGLYFLSIMSIMIFSEIIGNENLAMISFFSTAAIATCILIYHFTSKPKYNRIDNTVVEEFKEWKNKKDKKKEIREAISSILWMGTSVVYLIISFYFGSWAFSWIIFIIAGLLEAIISLIFKIKE